MLLDHIGMIIVYPLYINACMVDGVEMMGELVPDEAKRLYTVSYTHLDVYKRQQWNHTAAQLFNSALSLNVI